MQLLSTLVYIMSIHIIFGLLQEVDKLSLVTSASLATSKFLFINLIWHVATSLPTMIDLHVGCLHVCIHAWQRTSLRTINVTIKTGCVFEYSLRDLYLCLNFMSLVIALPSL